MRQGRSPCFGFCPAYRLSVAAGGRLHFESRSPDDSGRTTVDSLPPAAAARLLAEAECAGLDTMPELVTRDPRLCQAPVTDAPTVTVAVYGPGDRTRRVVDETGCEAVPDSGGAAGTLARWRAYEDAIDSAARSPRWLRPPRRR